MNIPPAGKMVLVKLHDDDLFVKRESTGELNGAGHLLCKVPDSSSVVPWKVWKPVYSKNQ